MAEQSGSMAVSRARWKDLSNCIRGGLKPACHQLPDSSLNRVISKGGMGSKRMSEQEQLGNLGTKSKAIS